MCVIWIFVECGVLVKKVRKKQLRETSFSFEDKNTSLLFIILFLSFFFSLSFFSLFLFLTLSFPSLSLPSPFLFPSLSLPFPVFFLFPFLFPFFFFYFSLLLFTSLSCHVLSFLKIKIKGNYISMQMWAMQHQCTSGRGWGL